VLSEWQICLGLLCREIQPMPDRDPVTGQLLPGNRVGRVGRMTRAKKAEAKLKEIENSLESDEKPLDHLLRLMRDRREPGSVRFAAAKAAAPYCHPQLQAIAHKLLGQNGEPVVPVVNLTVMQLPDLTKPKLTARGPDDKDTVQ
jgi:hypothetical protein